MIKRLKYNKRTFRTEYYEILIVLDLCEFSFTEIIFLFIQYI